MSGREIDVVVLGATGVTGRRVAAYLSTRAPEAGLSWAAAGRDAGRVGSVLAQEGVKDARTVIADTDDPASLSALAASAGVVLDLVGPYTLHGRPVIEACVAEGAHYVDLTGEIPFVRTILEEFDDRAAQAGVKVVQVCGFEALPPDMSVRIAAEEAQRRWGEDLQSVDVEVTVSGAPGIPRASDIISGGTLQSLMAVAGGEGAETISDPAALVTDAGAATTIRARSPIAIAPRRGREGGVLAPMAPAPFINPAVIHRSTVLAGAQPLRYREGMEIGGPAAALPLRWGAAGALTATQVGLRGFAGVAPRARKRVAGALSRALPGSGFGPAADRLESWRWSMRTYATTVGGNELAVRVDATGHPGYLATARMMGEAGLLLARDGATPARSGCLTPSIALGAEAAPSFERAGVSFSLQT
ncbi:MAG TPA: saccharopine dehydrogenase NADP-binding domain-containing protein [Solirubrobacteraceae bacterium]|nr:saccharopine dehydrogenase NADP-binding domain-containing protein [Solirubrobacteraceae bacterium]